MCRSQKWSLFDHHYPLYTLVKTIENGSPSLPRSGNCGTIFLLLIYPELESRLGDISFPNYLEVFMRFRGVVKEGWRYRMTSPVSHFRISTDQTIVDYRGTHQTTPSSPLEKSQSTKASTTKGSCWGRLVKAPSVLCTTVKAHHTHAFYFKQAPKQL